MCYESSITTRAIGNCLATLAHFSFHPLTNTVIPLIKIESIEKEGSFVMIVRVPRANESEMVQLPPHLFLTVLALFSPP